MYKVVINKVNFGESISTNFEGEGTTIQAALNRAKKEMNSEFPGGVTGYNYNTYKFNENNIDKWVFLQSFGA